MDEGSMIEPFNEQILYEKSKIIITAGADACVLPIHHGTADPH
jgi:hypothetical protein